MFSSSREIKQYNRYNGFVIVSVIVSMAHFPMFLARTAVIMIPAFAVFENQVRGLYESRT